MGQDLREIHILLASQGYEVIATVESVHEVHSLRLEAGNDDLPMTVIKLKSLMKLTAYVRALGMLTFLSTSGIGEGGFMIDVPENAFVVIWR